MSNPKIDAIANRHIGKCLEEVEVLEPNLKRLSKIRIKQAVRFAVKDVAEELNAV